MINWKKMVLVLSAAGCACLGGCSNSSKPDAGNLFDDSEDVSLTTEAPDQSASKTSKKNDEDDQDNDHDAKFDSMMNGVAETFSYEDAVLSYASNDGDGEPDCHFAKANEEYAPYDGNSTLSLEKDCRIQTGVQTTAEMNIGATVEIGLEENSEMSITDQDGAVVFNLMHGAMETGSRSQSDTKQVTIHTDLGNVSQEKGVMRVSWQNGQLTVDAVQGSVLIEAANGSMTLDDGSEVIITDQGATEPGPMNIAAWSSGGLAKINGIGMYRVEIGTEKMDAIYNELAGRYGWS